MASCIRLLLIAAVIAGFAAVVAAPGEVLAKKAKPGTTAQAAAPGPVVVPDSNIPADRVPRCFDSPIRYPSPPCY